MSDGSELMTTQMLAQLATSGVSSSSNIAKAISNIFGGPDNEVDKWFCDNDTDHKVLLINIKNPATDFLQRCIEREVPIKIYDSDFGKKVNTIEETTFAFRSCDSDLINEIVTSLKLEERKRNGLELDLNTQDKFDGIKTSLCEGLEYEEALVLQRELTQHNVMSLMEYNEESQKYTIEISYTDLSHEYFTEDGVHKMNDVEVAFADAFLKMDDKEYKELLKESKKMREDMVKTIDSHIKGTAEHDDTIWDSVIADTHIDLTGTKATFYNNGDLAKTYDLTKDDEVMEMRAELEKFNKASFALTEDYNKAMETVDTKVLTTGLNLDTALKNRSRKLEESICKPLRDKHLIDINYIADRDESNPEDPVKWKAKEVRIGNSAEVAEIMLKDHPNWVNSMAKEAHFHHMEGTRVPNENGGMEDITRETTDGMVDRMSETEQIRLATEQFKETLDSKAHRILFNKIKEHETLITVHDVMLDDPDRLEFILDGEDPRDYAAFATATKDGTIVMSEEDVERMRERTSDEDMDRLADERENDYDRSGYISEENIDFDDSDIGNLF